MRTKQIGDNPQQSAGAREHSQPIWRGKNQWRNKGKSCLSGAEGGDSLPDTFWLERIGREKEEANEIVPTKRNKRSTWRNDLNECIDHIMGEVARASQGDGARSAWTPEENVSAVCLGHCPVAECGVATDGRRDCAAWD